MSVVGSHESDVASRLPAGLLDRIVSHLRPQRVIVFGSQATGQTRRDSDWDLLVVVDDDIPGEQIGWRGIHKAREGIRGAIDLIPCRESVFRERMDVIGSLPWIALNEGVVVYERSKAA
jgi:uncharacterized protein